MTHAAQTRVPIPKTEPDIEALLAGTVGPASSTQPTGTVRWSRSACRTGECRSCW